MLATADLPNHYGEQIIYESEWTENTSVGISWLNLLTAQSIPEETDGMDTPCSPDRIYSESDCSESSEESCYVVLEIQRPRLADSTPSKADEDEKEEEEEEEEEEEMEEEIEELNFAHIKTDEPNVEYEQFAVSLSIEVPVEEYVIEHQHEQLMSVEEYANVTQPIIQQTANDILFREAKTLSKFTKRMKAMSSVSTFSDDESPNITKLRTIRKVHEYHAAAIVSVGAENKSNTQHSNSTTSLDSIEDKPLTSSSVRTRITTTFSNLSSQRPLNPIQMQRAGPTMGTTTLTRTFAFDRACMEKYGQAQEQNNDFVEISIEPLCETIDEEEIKLPSNRDKQTELSSHDPLNCRSFTNSIPIPFYVGSESSTIDDLEFEHHSPTPQGTSMPNSLSKTSSFICLMKKYTRQVTSEYRLTRNNNENITAEPTLLQVKYLDGRLPYKDDNIQGSFRKPPISSGSVSSRFNRLALPKMSSTQDLSTSSSPTSFNSSYRKRVFNRFRTLLENNIPEQQQQQEQQPIPQARPWQHKTISELFNERKYKANRH